MVQKINITLLSGWDSDWNNYISSNNLASDDYMNLGYTLEETLDERADVKGAFMFVMAFGRTFRAGALNIPVNVFYSSRGKGGIAGINVGFNVTKSKSTVGTGLFNPYIFHGLCSRWVY